MTHERSEQRRHSHVFDGEKKSAERRTLSVVVITLAMMTVEISVGWLSNSMALLADGWHMGTHAFALGLSWLAYRLARKHAGDRRYAFGTWKIEILGAYSSAVVLGLVGVLMIGTSVERWLHPRDIRYGQALIVAGIGLIVNIVCAVILDYREGRPTRGRHPAHAHGLGEDGHHDHRPESAEAPGLPRPSSDLNLKSAYLHVAADALTSVLAIAALLGAKYFHWIGLDPAIGIVGAGLILRWAFALLKETSGILLDRAPVSESPLAGAVVAAVESGGGVKVCDVHLWKVAPHRYACILSLLASEPLTADDCKARLTGYPELVHLTVEIHRDPPG